MTYGVLGGILNLTGCSAIIWATGIVGCQFWLTMSVNGIGAAVGQDYGVLY